MKKVIIISLCGLFFTATLDAQNSGIIGSIAWSLTGNELTLSGTGANGEGVIPSNFFGLNFFGSINKQDVEQVVIVDGITEIGDFAFASTRIASVSIPASVTIIELHAFRQCNGLLSISVNTANSEFYSDDGVLFSTANSALYAYPPGKTGEYFVPDGTQVIGDMSFWLCSHLTTVVIPQSVTAIGEYAFSETGLTAVTIHYSKLLTIGKGAFQYCYDLISVFSTNDALQYIGDYAFSECHSLTAFDFPPTVEIIGEGAFEFCHSLDYIEIPASVRQIGDFAFWDCQKLTSVFIPASVEIIGNGAFGDCVAMTDISVSEDNMDYSSIDGVLFNKNATELIAFPNGKTGDYLIPGSVEIIENAAFWNCLGLTSVRIPVSVTTIHNNAFKDCSNLEIVVNFNPDPLPLPTDVFSGVNVNTCLLRVPETAVDIYENTAVWMDFHNIEPLDIDVVLSHDSICLLSGNTAELTAQATGDITGDEIVVWTSDLPAVASVSNNGAVTANGAGTALITATVGSSEAKCTVIVLEPGKTTIEGTVNTPNSGSVRVNLYVKVDEPTGTKKGIIGGYVLLATVIPNTDGKYSFENLPEGSYQIEVEMDDLETEASDAIPVTGDETNVIFDVSIDDGEIVIIGVVTGTEDIFDDQLIIYPNPFTDAVRISGLAAMVETRRATSLQVINAAGVVVHTQTITHPEQTIELAHLPTGMYLIRLENGGIAKTVKVVKMK